jgi:hypothetical protein
MMKLNGGQRRTLHEGLKNAFRSRNELQRFLDFEFDIKLADIADQGNLNEVVFATIDWFVGEGRINELIERARAEKPRNPELQAVAEQFAASEQADSGPAMLPTGHALERVIKEERGLLDARRFHTRMFEQTARICQITIQSNQGPISGTGFLLGPDLVMTNYHVIEPVIVGEQGRSTADGLRARAQDVLLRFDYYMRDDGVIESGAHYGLTASDWLVDQSPPSPLDHKPEPKHGVPRPDELDYVLLRVDGQPGLDRPNGTDNPIRGWIEAPPWEYDFKPRSNLLTLLHAPGNTLQFGFDQEAIIEQNSNHTRVTYTLNTLEGASGSPCFNIKWELVALHQGTDPAVERGHKARYNQGIPFAAIMALLKARGLAGVLGGSHLIETPLPDGVAVLELGSNAGASSKSQSDIASEAKRFFYALEHRLRGQIQQAEIEHVRRTIEAILVESGSDKLPTPDEVMNAALWLWDQFYEEARETIIQCLLWADQAGHREQIYERFRNGKPRERRLLRDPRLKDIAPDLAQYWYNWPPIEPKRLVENSSIKRWLDRHDFEANPFGSRSIDRDLYLLKSWAFPNQWDFVTESRSSAIWTEVRYDRVAAVLMLRHELQSAVPQTSFLIWRTLPLPDIIQESTLDDSLRAVTRAIADMWIRFLASNPWALLDLPRSEQMSLAEMLLWQTGTRQKLRQRLVQAGLGESVQENALWQRLESYTGEEQYKGTPLIDELLSWLQIRPPGLDHTYFIVDCPADRSQNGCRDQINHVASVASALIDVGISMKIYHALLDIELSSVDSLHLTWNRDHLLHMLRQRIYLASKERLKTFGELFGLEPFKAADDLLVDHAHGSLGKMLELGDTLIREHIQRHKPDDHYLYPEDLAAVLQRSASTA